MNHLLTTVLFLALCWSALHASGQRETGQRESARRKLREPVVQIPIDTLHWSATRRLELSDFHSPAQPGLGGSEFYYQIGYEVRPTSIGSVPALDAFCLMFRNLSWVSETARTERTLAYNQVLFDLVEIHTRQMKGKLIELVDQRNFKQQAKQIEYLTNAELGAEVNRFRAETGGGDDRAALELWQQRVVQRLFATPDLVTTYHASSFGFGFFVGGGGALPVGLVAQAINPLAGRVTGLDLAFGRTLILVHPAFYAGGIRAGFSQANQTWETGMQIKPTALDIGVGRVVRDTPRSRLIPYAGYRFFQLTPRDRDDERYKGLSLISHSPTIGLMYDFKMGKKSHQPDEDRSSFLFVRAKLSYSQLLGNQSFSGGMIGLQIGVGGFGRLRKVTYQPERTVIVLPGKLM